MAEPRSIAVYFSEGPHGWVAHIWALSFPRGRRKGVPVSIHRLPDVPQGAGLVSVVEALAAALDPK